MRIVRDLTELVCDGCSAHAVEATAKNWLVVTRLMAQYGTWTEGHYCSRTCLLDDVIAARLRDA